MPIWKVVFDGKVPLSEVKKWDMEDIDRFHDYQLMKQDYRAALTAFHQYNANKEKPK